jgi:AcrR family transcriptional regulator
MSDDVVKRAYSSPLRTERARNTRARIRQAGERLFVRCGYVATSMKEVAEEAGVAERTLYLAFPSKAELLNEIIRVTVRGHDRDEPLVAGQRFRSVVDAPPGELLARFAEVAAELMGRTAQVLAIGEAAAPVDPALTQFRERGHAATRSDMREIAAALRQRGELAPHATIDDVADVLFAVAGNETLYLRLVGECGWSEQRYARLLEQMLSPLLG